MNKNHKINSYLNMNGKAQDGVQSTSSEIDNCDRPITNLSDHCFRNQDKSLFNSLSRITNNISTSNVLKYICLRGLFLCLWVS